MQRWSTVNFSARRAKSCTNTVGNHRMRLDTHARADGCIGTRFLPDRVQKTPIPGERR
jgi:hypothetical protein